MEQDKLENIYASIERMRINGKSLSRFGSADENGKIVKEIMSGVCFAEMKYGNYFKDFYYFYFAWNGEAIDLSQSSVNKEEYGDRDMPYRRSSEFHPGPLSDFWLGFMLDPVISPWRAILPHLVSTDPEVIRSSGMIFKDAPNINFGLLFNFIIACRYAYEFNHRVLFFQELIEKYGVDPRAAYLISISYTKPKTGKDLKPPLRKVIKQPAGYRKNSGGFRYIRDEFGDKQWFPAEFEMVDDHPDWKPGSTEWDGEMTRITGDGHCPLGTMEQYSSRVMNNDPDLSFSPPFKGCHEFNYPKQAWDIFRNKDEPKYYGNNYLMEVVNHLNKLIK